MTFTLPQFGIFARGTQAHHFLEFDGLYFVAFSAAYYFAPSLNALNELAGPEKE